MIEEAAAEIRADGINQLLATSEIEVEMREFIYHGLKALERIEWAINEVIEENEPTIATIN